MSTQFSSVKAYEQFVGRYGAELAAALVDFAALGADADVLDVGCGPGALTSELVRRLGPHRVSAVDPSEPFAAACRDRFAGVDVRLAGAESLPFADDTFDATFSQLVVNFVPDPLAGAREMARVTRRGGTVASCVWDYGGGMTLLRAFWDAAAQIEPGRAAQADEGETMPWCHEGGLAELWRHAGLEHVRGTELLVHASYADFEDLWAPLPMGVGPAGAFCASLDEDAREALHDALRARLGVDGGPFELEARAWAAVGRVP